MSPSSSRRLAARLPLYAALGLVPLASFVLPSCGRDPVCGDARIDEEQGEECDDGNLVENDECTNACKLPACGDGIVSAGIGEECDDGDPENPDAPGDDTDDCTNSCKVAICGDGVRQAGVEECDDGNVSEGDGCREGCLKATCGDGVRRTTDMDGEPPEECDDGNDDSTDNCTIECKEPRCGDGFVRDNVEECDDGNDVDDDACPTSCLLPFCGDGFVNPATEECDDANTIETDSCRPDCTAAKCGDGIVQTGEECDDSNLVAGDYCSPICKKECFGGDAAGLFEGRCYIYFPGPVTWPQANCNALGSHIATIFSSDENTFVQGLLPAGTTDAWIGLTDQAFESSWVWQLDQAGMVLLLPPITKWAPAQPDDLPVDGMNGADCAVIGKATGLWSDQPCEDPRGVVCEYEYEE